MAEKPVLSARIPPETANDLDEFQEEEDVSQSEAVRRLLQEQLGEGVEA
jgi:metal-responsive CopG/Arc/MetJ family transcriptional regulator